MGDSPEKIGADPFLFRFVYSALPFSDHLILLFHPDCRGAGQHGDSQHEDKCNRVSVQCKIHGKERVGKKAIDGYHTENSRKNPACVTGCVSGNHQQSQNINQSIVGGIIFADIKDYKSESRRGKEQHQCIYAVVYDFF